MKPKIKNVLKPLAKLHWVVWLGLFLVSLTVSFFALRHNNLTMEYLLNQVYAADNNNQNVEQPLDKLQVYVTTHMNTSLTTPNGIYPPIQLANTYKRLAAASTSNIYHDAQVYCQRVEPNGFYGQSRLNCVEPYVEEHQLKPADIPAGLYEFDFVSPTWSPDLAGWSLVASSGFLVIFLARFLPQRVRK